MVDVADDYDMNVGLAVTQDLLKIQFTYRYSIPVKKYQVIRAFVNSLCLKQMWMLPPTLVKPPA